MVSKQASEKRLNAQIREVEVNHTALRACIAESQRLISETAEITERHRRDNNIDDDRDAIAIV
jgi:hypothetical protein